ncbi:MAG: molybdopterin-dependent oxidoreductase [Betaproteobacteria bacterium]|nr:molybdopterin-dependent oxidoreductase [Betaproteobacteria bacterium]
MFTRYDLKNAKAVAYEVVSNRPKVNAFRAPGVPPVVFGVESVVDELAKAIGMDPLELRLKNAATEGYTTIYGETFGPIGFVETLEAAMKHEHYRAPHSGPNCGRGVAAGFWWNRAGDTSGKLRITADGSVNLLLGTIDIGGSRVSMCMMAAEELGIPLERVSAVIANTDQVSYNRLTAGSRVTFSSGIIVVDCARQAIAEMRRRAAGIWHVSEGDVVYEDPDAGMARGELPHPCARGRARGTVIADEQLDQMHASQG